MDGELHRFSGMLGMQWSLLKLHAYLELLQDGCESVAEHLGVYIFLKGRL